MLRRHFSFDLPTELIAQQPLTDRSTSRLLRLHRATSTLTDHIFYNLPNFLDPSDLLVFNDTQVIPARLRGHKASGGHVEVLIERIHDEHHAFAHVRASKSPKVGTLLQFAESCVHATVIERHDDLFLLHFADMPITDVLQRYGETPLPPYIDRPVTPEDTERYQTVYAKKPGAIAAPTAGLHFDQRLLERLAAKGVEFAFVTLHVGAGTFQPVRTEQIESHQLHKEWLEVDEVACQKITATRTRGGRVIAVGTTVVRSLETACQNGGLKPFRGETQLFIYPGYVFQCVDALITNFHLPESSLLMLVCAFAEYDKVMHAYHHAVKQRYRFFSYGDAMLIE